MVTGNTPASGHTNTVGFESGTDSAFIRVVSGSGAATPETCVDTTNWHEYAVTRDGSDIVDFYVDGTLAAGDVFSGAECGPFRFTRLAKDNAPEAATAFDGPLAGIAFWDSNLSAADIAEWHAGPEPEYTSAPRDQRHDRCRPGSNNHEWHVGPA